MSFLLLSFLGESWRSEVDSQLFENEEYENGLRAEPNPGGEEALVKRESRLVGGQVISGGHTGIEGQLVLGQVTSGGHLGIEGRASF